MRANMIGILSIFCAHLLRGLAATREQSATAQRKVLGRCKFAAKNSENSEAQGWARAVRRDDLRSWVQFPRRTAVRSCCFVGKLFLRLLGVAFATFGVIAPPANSGSSASPAPILMPVPWSLLKSRTLVRDDQNSCYQNPHVAFRDFDLVNYSDERRLEPPPSIVTIEPVV